MAMTPLSGAPNRATDTPAQFSTKMDTLLNELPGFVTGANALQADVTTKQGTASTAATNAEIARAAAVVARLAAEDAEDAAAGHQVAASGSASAASGSASAAAASATLAANYAAALTGTSASAVAIATGSKAFTASTGKQWVVNATPLNLVSASDPAKFMFGMPTAYNPSTGALTVNVTAVGGSGSPNDWVISPAGLQGPQGVPGAGLVRLNITGNATATVNRHHDLKAAADLTLPAAPTAGDRVAGTKLTTAVTQIISNKPINGQPSGTFPIVTMGFCFDLTFKDNTDGWVNT